MRKILKILIFFILFPSVVFAQEFMEKMEKITSILVDIVIAFSTFEFVYAGFLFATAAGDPEKISRARSILIYATIGIGVAAISWSLAKFVITTLRG